MPFPLGRHFILFVHILFVTGILNSDNVFMDAISIIPFASMCHVEMLPSVECGLTTTQCLLNLTHIPDSPLSTLYDILSINVISDSDTVGFFDSDYKISVARK